MDDLSPLTVDPLASDSHEQKKDTQEPQAVSPLERFLDQVKQAGLVEPFVRVGTLLLSLTLIFLLVWGMRSFYLRASLQGNPEDSVCVLGAAEPTPTPVGEISVRFFRMSFRRWIVVCRCGSRSYA